MAFYCEKCGKAAHAGFVEVNIADMQEFLLFAEKLNCGEPDIDLVLEATSLLRKYKSAMTNNTLKEICDDIEGLLKADEVNREIAYWIMPTSRRPDRPYVAEWRALKDELSQWLTHKSRN